MLDDNAIHKHQRIHLHFTRRLEPAPPAALLGQRREEILATLTRR